MAKQLFQPGVCPNPSGRPKGIMDYRSRFRDLVEEHAPGLLDKAVSMALEGNEQMLKLLLDRILPAKPKDDPVNINIVTRTLGKQSEIILEALSSGEISPTEALNLQRAVVNRAKILQYNRSENIDSMFGDLHVED